MIKKILIFLIINFSALAIGGLFTSEGVTSDWYFNLNKAPWTPPGWVFGAAWTTIMICFAVYMAFALKATNNITQLVSLFALQWILNVSWNPIFFHLQEVIFALIVIGSLTFLIGFFLFKNITRLKFKSLLILPYFIWLLIATSLNAYILIQN